MRLLLLDAALPSPGAKLKSKVKGRSSHEGSYDGR
jgi:hypothetical protein